MVLMANMQMERPRVGDCCHNHQLDRGLLMESKFYSNDSSPLVLQPCSFSSGSGRSSAGGGGLGHIEHTVSKFDTLVGIAIKYGVEVADIKRMNYLTTDQQIFALKLLQIPLPGRHPPSPIVSNGTTSSEAAPVHARHSDLFNSIKLQNLSSSSQHNVSPSRNNLPGYCGHKPNDQNSVGQSFEMAIYHEGSVPFSENGVKLPLGVHRKSKSLVNGFSKKGEVLVAKDKDDGSDKCLEKLVRRRKSEIGLTNTETPVKQDNITNSSAAKRGSLPRQKTGTRASNDTEALMVETLTGVRKSSSTPSFEDSGSNNHGTSSSSIWPTSMLNLTADLQALSTAAIAIPKFDGLPKPSSGRKNKAALD